MSMNFGREQSLLRQKLSVEATPAAAAARQQDLDTDLTCLGTSDTAIAAAAQALVAAHPQMGRAQMTAFVRTLWRSRIHELRVVGVELLAARHHLLEPADLPFVEELLRDCRIEAVAARLADAVLGAMVLRSKKLWKDLERLAGHKDAWLGRAAVLACRLPLLGDAEAFPRFAGVAQRLAAAADAELWAVIDAVLLAIATPHGDAARKFAELHGRKLQWPSPTVVLQPVAPVAAPAAIPAAPPASPKAGTKERVRPRAKASAARSKSAASAAKPRAAKITKTAPAKQAAKLAKATRPATAGSKSAAAGKRRPAKKG